MITQFQKGSAEPVDYPCIYSEVPWSTQMVNVCDGIRHGVPEPHCIHSDEYREEAEALVRLAMDVERGIWPEWYLDFCGIDTRLSPILKDFAGLDEMDPKGCADIVRMDHPAELWMALTQYTVTEGIAVAPQYKGIRFLERAVDPLTEYSEMLSPAMHRAFEVKYYFGFARPEEYFESPNFSHYPEGCPAHPSYIAGHGTAGGVANAAFQRVFTEAQREHLDAVETATKQFAHFRDFARVHTRQDSANGWRFGNGDFG